jgi:dynein heavy chain, axonemal
MDPTALLLALAQSKGMEWNAVSLGQGQAPKAQRMMEDSAKQGTWAYLANCHLSVSWLPGLEKLIERLNREKPHPSYRLWMSSSPTPAFPIAMLQSCIKMTTEPPKGRGIKRIEMYI